MQEQGQADASTAAQDTIERLRTELGEAKAAIAAAATAATAAAAAAGSPPPSPSGSLDVCSRPRACLRRCLSRDVRRLSVEPQN